MLDRPSAADSRSAEATEYGGQLQRVGKEAKTAMLNGEADGTAVSPPSGATATAHLSVLEIAHPPRPAARPKAARP